MHAEESVFGGAYGCVPSRLNPFAGPAEPSFTDISDVDAPRMHVSTFGLAINRLENCAAQLDSGVQASVHYHEFDSRENAKIAIVSMQNAGIRVVDVRDPAHPLEIAYFNPGDVDAGPGVSTSTTLGATLATTPRRVRSGSPPPRAASGSSSSSRRCAATSR